jgi:methionine aminopeptidase
MSIANKVGAVVEGNDFFGREKELKYAWNLITHGDSLILSAPRRVGKSSFSKKMLKLATEAGWKSLYVDLQGIKTEEQFVKLFIEKIQAETWWSKLGKKAGKIVNSIHIKIKGFELNSSIWQSDIYDNIQKLVEETGEILIVMDELTIFLNNLLTTENGKEKVESFLNWMRSIRQISGSQVRWIFCSSVGIENFAVTHNLSYTLNDVHPFPIDAFTENEAKEFISKLDVSEKIVFTESHIQYILNKLSWYLPFFIQILVAKIYSLVYVQEKELSEQTIDEAYNQLITEKHFNSWDERLKEYKENEKYIRHILKRLCKSQTGESREILLDALIQIINQEQAENILAKILHALQNDGYIIVNNDRKYVFRSPLLRDFWFNRFAL